MPLERYDVIDLDAYGIPFLQLETILKYLSSTTADYKVVIYVTFIQSFFGRMVEKILYELGYSKNMIKKIPTLFSRNAFEKICDYLSMYQVQKIKYRCSGRKYYFCFSLKSLVVSDSCDRVKKKKKEENNVSNL